MQEFLNDLSTKLVQLSTSLGLNLVYAAVLLIVGRKLIRWLTKSISSGKLLHKIDNSLRSFLKSFLSISLYALLFITIAVILGVPVTSFITVLASCGVAIGLALQGSLSNFVGGIMILLFKPFQVGDYIETSNNSGTVHDITIFYTILNTIDNKTVTLPNGTLTNVPVVNYTAQKQRRVDLTFSVAYASDIEEVKALLLEVAQAHPLVLDDPAPIARLLTQNSSSLDFTLRAWCKSEDYWTVYFDLNETTKKTLDAHHIEIPFQQMDVHLVTQQK